MVNDSNAIFEYEVPAAIVKFKWNAFGRMKYFSSMRARLGGPRSSVQNFQEGGGGGLV